MKKFSELKVGDSFYMWYDGEFYEGVILSIRKTKSIRKTEHHIELYTKFKKENCENFYTCYHCISEIDKEIYITCVTEESQEIVATSMDKLLLELE